MKNKGGVAVTEREEIDFCLNCRAISCRWGNCAAFKAQMQQDSKPRKAALYYTAFGETRTLSEWARIGGLKKSTLYGRVELRGLSVEEAIRMGEPQKGSKAKEREAFGEKRTLTEWARLYGIEPNTLGHRMNKCGMTLEAALLKGPPTGGAIRKKAR